MIISNVDIAEHYDPEKPSNRQLFDARCRETGDRVEHSADPEHDMARVLVGGRGRDGQMQTWRGGDTPSMLFASVRRVSHHSVGFENKRGWRLRKVESSPVAENSAAEDATSKDNVIPFRPKAEISAPPRNRSEADGTCPECGGSDGYRNVGREHWGFCAKHNVRWRFGSNLYSSWQDETEADWARNEAYLTQLRVVRA